MFKQDRRKHMPKCKYDVIYKDLKRRLEEGEYPHGELLPSENTR